VLVWYLEIVIWNFILIVRERRVRHRQFIKKKHKKKLNFIEILVQYKHVLFCWLDKDFITLLHYPLFAYFPHTQNSQHSMFS